MAQFSIRTIAHREESSTFNLALRILVRFLQFVMALAVAGLYGTDLNAARKAGKYMDSKWVYAEACAGISCFTIIVYAIPRIKSWWCFGWDAVLFVLWMALFGIFGNMYIGEDPEGDGGVQRMKNAVWVDLTNMLLWFITAAWGCLIWVIHRKNLQTDSAKV